MDWVHCNNCAAKPAQTKMYLTMCGHVFCHNCCGKAKENQCYLCKKPLKASEINKNLRCDLLALFKDPHKALADGMTEIRNVVTFQAKQREYFVKFRNSESKQESDSFNETRMAHIKASQEMEKRKKALSEDNEKLKNEKERRKMLMERLQNLQREVTCSSSQIPLPRSKTEPMPSKNGRFHRPAHLVRRGSREVPMHHPLDQSTSKIVTSTPIANIDFSRRDYMNRMFGAGHANPSPIPRH